MFQLIYTSIASREITKADIAAILKKSEDFNVRNKITGCLLYYKKEFVQVLEGEKAVVKKLFARIKTDKRHSHVTLISEDTTDKRTFTNWQMAGYEVNENDIKEINMQRLKENLMPAVHPGQRTLTVRLFWKMAKLLIEKKF